MMKEIAISPNLVLDGQDSLIGLFNLTVSEIVVNGVEFFQVVTPSSVFSFPKSFKEIIRKFPIFINDEDWGKIGVEEIGGVKIWKFPAQTGHPLYPGFFYINHNSSYVINVDGVVKNSKTGKTKSPWRNKDGYIRYNMVSDLTGYYTNTGRYRALLMAFTDVPEDYRSLDINHLNGIKHDDRLENLEWASRSRNCSHAYENGLRLDNQRVLVRNALNGGVIEFISYAKCARAFKLTHQTVSNRVKSKGSKIYPGYLQFKLKSDETPWTEFDDPFSELIKAGFPLSIKALDVTTGSIFVFRDIAHASRELGFIQSSIANELRVSMSASKKRKPFSYLVFKALDDKSPWPTFSQDEVEIAKICKAQKRFLKTPGYILTDKITGDNHYFAFPEDIKTFTGLSMQQFLVYVKKGFYKNFIIRHLSPFVSRET